MTPGIFEAGLRELVAEPDLDEFLDAVDDPAALARWENDRASGRLARDAAIYFVRSGSAGPVKIGYANGALRARLVGLQVGNPVELVLVATWRPPGIGCVDELERLEKHLHDRFLDSHIRGEWFGWTSAIESFIRENCCPGAP